MTKFLDKNGLQTVLIGVGTALGKKINAPTGGTVGQVLTKTDEGTEWRTVASVNGCSCEDLTSPELDEIMKGMASTSVAYVDLGLPSGNLWATCNLGAEKETDSGLYFQWGDVKGYKGACQESESDGNDDAHYFNWSKYKFGTRNDLTKYCTQSSYGVVDNKTVLEAEDDAVVAALGGNWKMPTAEDFQELIDNTDPGDGANEYDWIEDYNGTGINGLLLKSKTNDNTIFFPASGYCGGSSLEDVGQGGYYWSSSLYSSDSNDGQGLYFGSGVLEVDGDTRFGGLPVRGVLSGK